MALSLTYPEKRKSKNINLLRERQARKIAREQKEAKAMQEEETLQSLLAGSKNVLTSPYLKGAAAPLNPLLNCFRDPAGLSDTIKDAVDRLYASKDAWIRPPETFKIRLYNPERQFSLLARHLLAKFKVPWCLDSVWYNKNKALDSVFVEVAQGNSIRSCLLPVTLTKKMAHAMMQAPAYYTIEQAVRYGQIRGLGGDIRLVEAVLATTLGSGFNNQETFWETVLAWMVKNPMLSKDQIQPLFDYLAFKKNENAAFTMKGRSVNALIGQMEEWHRFLGKEEIKGKWKTVRWKQTGINSFIRTEGDGENAKTWTITEILSSKELHEEGAQMHHCVYSYHSACIDHRSAIFSLKCNQVRCLTIQVSLPGLTVLQMKGIRNRSALNAERRIVSQWAGQNHLKMGQYL